MSLTAFGMKILAKMDPETAHRFVINLLRLGLVPRNPLQLSDPILEQEFFGIKFSNPIGLAAGFDKNAEAFNAILALGCGFVEVGSFTPKPQFGNPKPRAFRLANDKAAISRHGFNNDGLDKCLKRLESKKDRSRIVGINIGINKDSKNPINDYINSVKQVAKYGDYLTLNISSPNTEGLRELQNGDNVDRLLKAVFKLKNSSIVAGRHPPIFLKVAPDISEKMIEDIVDIALKYEIDGLIVANTTIARPPILKENNRNEVGGLSGRPIFELSTRILAKFYIVSEGKINLIGSGGIDSVKTAYQKIKAGASLIQIYTGLMYYGPRLFQIIYNGFAYKLRNDGFSNINEAVGIDADKWHKTLLLKLVNIFLGIKNYS